MAKNDQKIENFSIFLTEIDLEWSKSISFRIF